MTAPITSARVRALCGTVAQWTAPSAIYPPYVNLTGNVLTVREAPGSDYSDTTGVTRPVCGRTISVILPDSALSDLALALCSESARDHIATALDLLERVQAGDAGLVVAMTKAMLVADSGPEGSALYNTHAAEFAAGYEDGARAALAALVGEG